VGRRLRQVFVTQRNAFGLRRQYHAYELPSHDPEDDVSLRDLSNAPTPIDPPEDPPETAGATFYPYPNHSSFRLGDWYWNGGAQKSQASFKDLVDIVSDPDFRTADIRAAKWGQINSRLANDNDDTEWLDDADAGWTRTPITIAVPFQDRRGEPSDSRDGPRDYAVGDFYHRSLVSIIREKLSNPAEDRLFHYEPYELSWQPGNASHPVRTYGELYTSPAFVDAHRQLQDSPAEPGCNRPRVIAAMMFWSDATHLTSFGDAKLHPLYMCFGNESKYRRGKPSCHLCHHVAYFQKVYFVYDISYFIGLIILP
jgi:hypothetical protein